MNNKTAKLIRKYANRSEEGKRSVQRRWIAMTQTERRRFRAKMHTVVGADSNEASNEASTGE